MVNLDTILVTGLILAIFLPAMALVSSTLPPPIINGTPNITIATQLGATGNLTYTNLHGTLNATQGKLIGNATSGLNSNPVTFQAFAFTVQGIGIVITDIVQLPIIDYNALNVILAGLGSSLPGVAMGFITFGTYALYLYMAFSLVMMGFSSVMKYNAKVG